MAIAFRDSVSANDSLATAGTSISTVLPSDIQSDDILIAVRAVAQSQLASIDATHFTPSGWTEIWRGSGGTLNGLIALYKVGAIGDAGSTVNWTLPSAYHQSVSIVAYSGGDPQNPIDNYSVVTDTVTEAAHAMPRVTAVAQNATTVYGVTERVSGATVSTWTASGTGNTLRAQSRATASSQNSSVGVADNLTAINAGSQSPACTLTGSVAVANDVTVAITLTPGPAQTFATGSGQSVVLAKPPNVVDGSVLMAVILHRTPGTWTVPTGWTPVSGAVSNDYADMRQYYKVIPTASAETATSYTWTTTAAAERCMGMLWIDAANNSTPIDQVGSVLPKGTNVGSEAIPATSATYAGERLYAMIFQSISGGAANTIPPPPSTPPGMHSIQGQVYAISTANNTLGLGMKIFEQDLSATGGTGTKTTTYTAPGASGSAGWLVTVIPAGVSTTSPVSITPSTAFNELTSVSISQNTAFNEYTRVTLTPSTAFHERADVGISQNTAFAERKLVTLTPSTAYAERAVVGVVPSTAFRVRTLVGLSPSTAYAVRALAAVSPSTAFMVRVGVIFPSTTAWTVDTRVTVTDSTAFTVRALVTSTRSTAFNDLHSIAATYSEAWNALHTALIGPQTAWNERGLVGATPSTAFDELHTVSSISPSTAYAERALVGISPSAAWNVASLADLTSVAQSYSTAYTVHALAGITDSSAWMVKVTVGPGDVTTTWIVRGDVGSLRATAWSLRALVTDSPSTAYAVRAVVGVTRATAFTDAARVTVTEATSWVIDLLAGITVSTEWEVRAPATITASTSWVADARVGLTASTSWNVFELATGGLTPDQLQVLAAGLGLPASLALWTSGLDAYSMVTHQAGHRGLSTLIVIWPLAYRVLAPAELTTSTGWRALAPTVHTISTAWNVGA